LVWENQNKVYFYEPIILFLKSEMEEVKLDKQSRLEMFPKLSNNRDFILKILEYDPNALNFISEDLREDLEIVKKSVSHFGIGLKYVHPKLKEKSRIVHEALKSNGLAFQKIYQGHFSCSGAKSKRNSLCISKVVS
jgi:hypothetical protein